jgi:hypothetical protein
MYHIQPKTSEMGDRMLLDNLVISESNPGPLVKMMQGYQHLLFENVVESTVMNLVCINFHIQSVLVEVSIILSFLTFIQW